MTPGSQAEVAREGPSASISGERDLGREAGGNGPGNDLGNDLSELEARLGVKLNDRALLQQALTHRSYAFEHELEHNERLEFLGDAVLSIVVTDGIYRAHPDAPEGRLAKLRAAAVRTESLADIGRDVDLGAHIRLGKGEQGSGGEDKDSILADTVEAVLGAIYLDRGIDESFKVIGRLLSGRLEDIAERDASLDYKTSLQELVASQWGELPRYHLEGEGPDHEREFTATVEVAGEVRGRGRGRSKKQAEQDAARVAYKELSQLPGA